MFKLCIALAAFLAVAAAKASNIVHSVETPLASVYSVPAGTVAPVYTSSYVAPVARVAAPYYSSYPVIKSAIAPVATAYSTPLVANAYSAYSAYPYGYSAYPYGYSAYPYGYETSPFLWKKK